MVGSTTRKGIGFFILSLVLVFGLLLPALVAPQTIEAQGPELYALVQIPSGQEASFKVTGVEILDSGGVYALIACNQEQLDVLKMAGYTVIGEPCDIGDAQCLAQLAAQLKTSVGSQSTLQLQGGPDTFGYKFIDSNEKNGPCLNWIDITRTGTNTGIHCDDCGVIVPIGFTFNLYTSSAIDAGISSNGYLGLSGDLADFSNDCIPNASTPNNIICPFWDDLISTCNYADILYQTFGSAPNRTFVVEWVNNKFFNDCNSPSLTFEAILYEGSNSILFQYLNMTGSTRANGDSATVGIENIDGTVGLQYSCESPAISNSLAILFYMPPPVNNLGCQASAVVPAKLKVSPTMPNNIKPAQMSLQYLNVNPQQASANQPVTILTNVVNTGDQAGSYNVVVKINGQTETSRTVNVAPQATQPITFTLTRAQPGTYALDVGGQKGSFTILDTASPSGKPANVGLIAIMVLGILLITTLVVMIAFRRTA